MALPNVDRLRELLEYDPETGLFTRRLGVRGYRAGTVAGALTNHGYIQCYVDRRNYLAHRLAWLHVHGVAAGGDIDHLNGNRGDNSLRNLRLADRAENMWNRGATRRNRAGIKGVHPHRHKWVAEICARGRRTYLGIFETAEEAGDAYAAAAARLHGEFARVA